MNDRLCGCCEGRESRTPASTLNRPGLEALRVRVGTHATFLETMLARLSTHRLPDGGRPLAGLTARTPDDPAVALLDAWATVADVLTFYQERIANEGYLLTATERRSVLELARLVGYRARPGVAASVYLAFEMERDQVAEIPAGTKAQSLPEPGELPQTFETDEAVEGRAEWNAIRPRLSRPTVLAPDLSPGATRTIWLEGAVTRLRVNAPLLLICGGLAWPYRVREVEPEPGADRTRVVYSGFQDTGPLPASDEATEAEEGGIAVHSLSMVSHEHEEPPPVASPLARLGGMVQALLREPSVPPASRFQLVRPLGRVYGEASDLAPRLLTRFAPALRDTLYGALRTAPVSGAPPGGPCRVEALRVSAGVFGHNAPPPEPDDGEGDDVIIAAASTPTNAVSLDGVYDEIVAGSWVVVERADTGTVLVTRVQEVRTRSRADYGIAARVTELVLAQNPWGGSAGESLAAAREMTVHALGEPLELAKEPVEEPVEGELLDLDGLYEGLEPGRWIMVRGERSDVATGADDTVEGVEATELVMVAGVEHDVGKESHDQETGRDGQTGTGTALELPGDTLHTRVLLAEPLAYRYRRDTVHINANVVRASHGESHQEVLGSGDGRASFQRFSLKRSPLTFVSAPTARGVESTLEVGVDGVRWSEAATPLLLGPSDRGYLTDRDDEETTSVVFGDGRMGARLPTGVENVTAVYRSGIGKGGNVAAGAISLLASRSAGVKEVVNPRRASGGADPESRDQARRNVPLAVQALDRLVSVEDYARFARTFAGVGKAGAWRLSDGRRQVVHLTIAGADDAPVDPSSALFRNLADALRRLGDPSVPVQVEGREAVFLFLGAGVRVLEDHRWEEVEPRLRAALLDALGFERRELGQGVRLGEVLAVMQAVDGVDHVDVDFLDGLSETEAFDPEGLVTHLETLTAAADGGDPCQPRRFVSVRGARIDPTETDPDRRIRPAQLAFLNPELSDTLILTELAP